MKNKYLAPKAKFENFKSEDVITASGEVNISLTAVASKTFSVSEANTSWNNKTQK